MKLSFGKSASIQINKVPLGSLVRDGQREFYGRGGEDSQRASALVNEVVRSAFGKTLPSFAPEASRAAVEPEKVEAAAFTDEQNLVRVVYREVVIRFEKGQTAAKKKVLAKYGLEERRASTFDSRKIIAFDPSRKYVAEGMVGLANELTELDEVEFAFPNFVSEFSREAVPKHATAQWHLKSIAAAAAWKHTRGSAKITVAILDDGVDVDHPNLKSNIRRKPDPSEPRDIHGRDFFIADDDDAGHFDPRPKQFRVPYDRMAGNDIHGTPCAGVVASRGIKSKILGIAPRCKILPVKVFHADDLAIETRVADAIRYASRFADVLSCSWTGPRSPDIDGALEDASAGRGGKGCPIFVASGNYHPDPVSYPASSPHAIAVGATTDGSVIANYSQRGSQISVCAPSSGGAKGITTADVGYSNRGFNLGTAAAGGVDGLHTNAFGGTSSATPLAAGVAALVLSVKPGLTRAALKKLLEDTADKVGPATSYDAHGHSDAYGFGQVNAGKAVAAAKSAGKAAKPTGAKASSKGRRKKPRRRD